MINKIENSDHSVQKADKDIPAITITVPDENNRTVFNHERYDSQVQLLTTSPFNELANFRI